MIDDGDVPHTRYRGHALEEPPIEIRVGKGVPVFRWGRRERNCDAIVGNESEIDALELAEAADEQAGSDEQNERERELCHHERGARACVVSRPYRATGTAAQTRE